MRHDTNALAGVLAQLIDAYAFGLDLIPHGGEEPLRRLGAGELRDHVRDLRLRVRAGRAALGPVTCALLGLEGARVKPTHFHRAASNASRAGKSFEADIDATNRAYAAAGLAAVARAHPPVGGIPGALYFKGKGDVDFVGHVLGIPVAFDTKSEAGAASYKHDAGEMHQLDFLIRWRELGGVAFLLLRDLERNALYLIDRLDSLRAGKSAPLRTHARTKSAPVSLVPSLVRTESERLLDAALGKPVWPWLDLAQQHDPRLAAAIAAHAGRQSA